MFSGSYGSTWQIFCNSVVNGFHLCSIFPNSCSQQKLLLPIHTFSQPLDFTAIYRFAVPICHKHTHTLINIEQFAQGYVFRREPSFKYRRCHYSNNRQLFPTTDPVSKCNFSVQFLLNGEVEMLFELWNTSSSSCFYALAAKEFTFVYIVIRGKYSTFRMQQEHFQTWLKQKNNV